MTASAFSKARKKFSETAFIELNQKVTQNFYQNATIQKWLGLRVLAVDGSDYRLPDISSLGKTFGQSSNQSGKTVPMALGSCLYDVFQGVVLDALLAAYGSSERDLAHQHLKASDARDLILYDRGYPAFWLFAAHRDQQRYFCMRARSNSGADIKRFIQSGKQQDRITLSADHRMKAQCRERGISAESLELRLVRIKTHQGEYILITNLLDKRRYPLKAFKQLYHLRWKIEEGYKKQKSWLEIENFTGKSALAIRQDFHARILTLTLASIVAYAAQPYLKSVSGKRSLSYQINFAQTLSAMRNTTILLLLGQLDAHELRRWLQSIAQSMSAIRPDRNFVRKKKVADRRKHHFSYKRVL